MIKIRTGIVTKIIKESDVIQIVELDHGGVLERAIVYPHLTGTVKTGNRVAFNATAVSLELGTGGDHFVICNLDSPAHDTHGKGHLMKMRYTPMQAKVMAVDEPDSKHHKTLKDACSIENMPVIAALLHSHIGPAAIAFKHHAPDANLAYIMTDGGALPAQYSELTQSLKKEGLVNTVITSGHSFGGDMEAMNLYSALLAAKHAAKADAAIIAMGPGIAGTSTRFGFTGIEQGQVINAIDSLGGEPVFIPRISFADARERHHGLSQQSIVNLKFIVRVPLDIALPLMTIEKQSLIESQIYDDSLNELHTFYYQDTSEAIDCLHDSKIPMKSMGRGLHDDPEFFTCAWLSGLEAALLAKGELCA